MAKQAKTDAVWTTIDPTTLPVPVAKQYTCYKEAYAEMKAERKAFEDALAALSGLPGHGRRMIFGYNFGKLSVAVVDAEPAKPSASGSTSLADFLKSTAASGRRT